MKKLSILLSMLMIVGMFGTVASAGSTTAKVTLEADNTTVKVGDIITVTVGLQGDDTLPLNGTLKACATWDATYFEYVADSAEVDSSTFGLTNDPTCALNSSGTYVTFTQKLSTDESKNIIRGGEDVFGTLQLKAIKETTGATATISLASATAVKYGSTAADTATADESATVAVTITAAGGDDEDVVTTYFSTESAVQTGKTPYWYATIGGVNKKKAATWEANVEGGSAKFGLIFTGSETISDMSIAWE